MLRQGKDGEGQAKDHTVIASICLATAAAQALSCKQIYPPSLLPLPPYGPCNRLCLPFA